MPHQTATEISHFLLTIGVLLAAARVFGEISRRLGQPAVIGEMFAGILLGPTVLGSVAPELFELLFPDEGAARSALEALITLSVALFLLVSGMEVDLSSVFRQGRLTLAVGISGMVVPFGLAFAVAWFAPSWVGFEEEVPLGIYAVFFATALSVSALPVISKILMDVDLLRSDMGVVSLAAAAFNDLCGWLALAVVLSLIGARRVHSLPVPYVIGLTALFALATLTVGRWLMHRLLPWLQAYTSWPGGVLSTAIAFGLLGAAFTEWIGVHAIMGAFLVGIAIGESSHLRRQTRTVISDFVSYFFAPLFFASIGLRVHFIASFDFWIVLVVLVVATFGKVVGSGVAAWLCGVPPRESAALGFMLNARGAMEVIVGALALEYGVIHARTFEALIIMALVTSMVSAPVVQRLIMRRIPRRMADLLQAGTFRSPLFAQTAREAIRELSRLAAEAAGLDPGAVDAAVWARESVMSTGLENGVAVPHARMDGLAKPVIAAGISPQGIDFDAPDGSRAHVVLLFLTPRDDEGLQLDLLADVARVFGEGASGREAGAMESFTEFLAFLRIGPDTGVRS